MTQQTLRALVEGRLNEDASLDSAAGLLVLAALDGEAALAAALAPEQKARGDPAPAAPAPAPAGSPAVAAGGAFLRKIAVQGFRGIGPEAALELTPGPGLTLVVGRNGSGKSSFAEGLELLLTGSSRRWDGPGRSAVWKEGWRNLHHGTPRIAAELLLEGQAGPCRVWRDWPDGAGLDEAETGAQVHGQPKRALADLGWAGALQTHRPFLSYNELGSVLEEGPTKLHDALSSILGLEDLTDAGKALAAARLARDKAAKAARARAKEIAALLDDLADDRAARARELLGAQSWDLDAVEALVTGGGEEGDTSSVDVLRRIASLEVPTLDELSAAVEALRAAAAAVEAAQGTLADRSRDLATLLDHALRFHDRHGDGPCPVCGAAEALTPAWREQRAREVETLRDAARAADAAHTGAKAAVEAAHALPFRWDPAFAGLGLDTGPAVAALEKWAEGAEATAPSVLADRVEDAGPPLVEALTALREAAKAELERRQDLWRPVAADLLEWVGQARRAEADAASLDALKAAEKWLKSASAALRDERFAPVAEKADRVWKRLRQQSHVELGPIRLEGAGPRRRLSLDVTVDGVEGAALGVMSQGELHALALSLFVPRATLPESPFRFLVIDDPVQSMDPARVEGLAEVLHETARDRQVVVFTHDDRLPEAVRRMRFPATIVEVTRREGSLVEPRPALDPVQRSIEDAMALARTESLPPGLAAQVVPGLCRQAVEAACQEAVRRRRLAAGTPHAEVERLLEQADTLKKLAALALYDDAERTSDVTPRLQKQGDRGTGKLFEALNRGAHGGLEGALEPFIRDSERLAGWFRGLK